MACTSSHDCLRCSQQSQCYGTSRCLNGTCETTGGEFDGAACYVCGWASNPESGDVCLFQNCYRSYGDCNTDPLAIPSTTLRDEYLNCWLYANSSGAVRRTLRPRESFLMCSEAETSGALSSCCGSLSPDVCVTMDRCVWTNSTCHYRHLLPASSTQEVNRSRE